MKKIFAILAIAGLAVTSFAQESDEPVYSVQTNSFWSNWFLSADYRYALSNGGQEDGFKPFKNIGDRDNHGFSIALGKWFTPGMGLRLKASGLTSQIMNVKHDKVDDVKSAAIEMDVMFNFSNLFCGYREKRVYNFIPYVGFGFLRNFDKNNNNKTYNAGLLNTWRLNKYLSINLDVFAMSAAGAWDGNSGNGAMGGQDVTVGAEVGLTVALGKKGWKKGVDEDALRAEYDGIIAGLNGRLSDADAENQRLRDALAKKPKEVVKTEIQKVGSNVPYSVFFTIGSAKMEKKQTVNLEAVAAAAKENTDLKVYVTGYADSATGSAKTNQKLSEKRAETLAKKLQDLGVSADQIVTEGKGGVAILSNNSYNRRAVIEIK